MAKKDPAKSIDDAATRVGERRAAATGALHVLVLSGPHKGRTHALADKLSIGKAEDNDLVLPDEMVSRHHCELARTAQGIQVRDKDSTNGTFVAGAKIREAIVSVGSNITIGDVDIVIRPATQQLEVLPSESARFGEARGKSLAMRTIFGLLERIAPTDATVLLEGETGTGKDVLARAVWSASARATKPFIVVDCGAISYSLIESELFGHERGAFTGAIAARDGAFALADQGTIFLDEIGELPLDVQPKLLRVLETGELRRVGGNQVIHTDVRVIAATKRDLQREVAAGKFREDLYFRLAVVPVVVPPLRARRDDIALLVDTLLATTKGTHLEVTPEFLEALAAHDWPGNVRELRNVLERAVYLALATGRRELSMVAMPQTTATSAFLFDPDKSYRELRSHYDAEFERRYAKWLLDRHDGNVSAAAREAKMDRKHLRDMAKKHALLRSVDDDE